MSASLAIIEQLARDAARIPDAETALRALGALRAEADQIESELVGRALRDGASWSQIARALGVTKQAAHRRYRHLTETAFNSIAGDSRILVTADARRSIQQAREAAKSLGQPAIGTEHILLGILRCPQTYAVKALAALGVTHQAVRAFMQPTMPGMPAAPPSRRDPGADGQNGVSPQARRILERSRREALNRQHTHIAVEHLLLALLADSRNGAVQTLEALKVRPAHVRRELDREWPALAVTGRSPGQPSLRRR